jgi:hypothetical protein
LEVQFPLLLYVGANSFSSNEQVNICEREEEKDENIEIDE